MIYGSGGVESRHAVTAMVQGFITLPAKVTGQRGRWIKASLGASSTALAGVASGPLPPAKETE